MLPYKPGTPERHTAYRYLDFCMVRHLPDYDLQNHNIMNLCCFKLVNLWWSVMAAKENYYDNQNAEAQTIQSLCIFKCFFSELSPNLRPLSLFIFSHSNMTLKIYSPYGFYFSFNICWKFDSIVFIHWLSFLPIHILAVFSLVMLFVLHL